jgi:hypothetical protein
MQHMKDELICTVSAKALGNNADVQDDVEPNEDAVPQQETHRPVIADEVSHV